MENENKDLIDLCQLNILEEKLDVSVLSDKEKEDTRNVIDWKKRRIAEKLLHKGPVATPDVLIRHIEQNIVNGKYIGEEKREDM